MPKYYGVARSSEYLAHYGVKGMKWGVIRKSIKDKLAKASKKRRDRKLYKRIDQYSDGFIRNPSIKHPHGRNPVGFLEYPGGKDSIKKENRIKLFNTMMGEYDKAMHGHTQDNGPKAIKAWQKIGNKHKQEYLRAVLNDADIPITKATMKAAHRIISAKDSEYSGRRYKKGGDAYEILRRNSHR